MLPLKKKKITKSPSVIDPSLSSERKIDIRATIIKQE